MKPDWDKLMKEDFGAGALVADVDCTAAGKPLCERVGVKGYPTLKYGDPSNLEDYKGGRTFADLKKFASENLKPMCSPANLDLCDDDKKAEINKLMEMSDEDLDAAIAEKEKLLKDAEETFKSEVEKLQNKYQELMAAKEATETEVKDSGLGLMKAVKAAQAKKGDAAKDEL